jgi:hypothetical protein
LATDVLTPSISDWYWTRRDLGREPQSQDYKRFTAVTFDDQHVGGAEPVVELAKTRAADFHFTAQIVADYRN